MRRVGAIGVGLCLLLAGCVPDERGKLLVANPFGQSPEVQQYRAMSSPASQEAALRVLGVGDQVVKANPEPGLRPRFATIGEAPQAEIFHRGMQDVFITEGLVKKCVTEG